MEDEVLCEQCGRQPASTTATRASTTVRLCEGCLEAEDRVPDAPIAAAWGLEGETLVEQVWPVAVNLHRFHVQRVLETGIQAPPRAEAADADDEDPDGPKA